MKKSHQLLNDMITMVAEGNEASAQKVFKEYAKLKAKSVVSVINGGSSKFGVSDFKALESVSNINKAKQLVESFIKKAEVTNRKKVELANILEKCDTVAKCQQIGYSIPVNYGLTEATKKKYDTPMVGANSNISDAEMVSLNTEKDLEKARAKALAIVAKFKSKKVDKEKTTEDIKASNSIKDIQRRVAMAHLAGEGLGVKGRNKYESALRQGKMIAEATKKKYDTPMVGANSNISDAEMVSLNTEKDLEKARSKALAIVAKFKSKKVDKEKTTEDIKTSNSIKDIQRRVAMAHLAGEGLGVKGRNKYESILRDGKLVETDLNVKKNFNLIESDDEMISSHPALDQLDEIDPNTDQTQVERMIIDIASNELPEFTMEDMNNLLDSIDGLSPEESLEIAKQAFNDAIDNNQYVDRFNNDSEEDIDSDEDGDSEQDIDSEDGNDLEEEQEDYDFSEDEQENGIDGDQLDDEEYDGLGEDDEDHESDEDDYDSDDEDHEDEPDLSEKIEQALLDIDDDMVRGIVEDIVNEFIESDLNQGDVDEQRAEFDHLVNDVLENRSNQFDDQQMQHFEDAIDHIRDVIIDGDADQVSDEDAYDEEDRNESEEPKDLTSDKIEHTEPPVQHKEPITRKFGDLIGRKPVASV